MNFIKTSRQLVRTAHVSFMTSKVTSQVASRALSRGDCALMHFRWLNCLVFDINADVGIKVQFLVTCCFGIPVDAPTTVFTAAICVKVQVHLIASTKDGGWQGDAASLLHQGCPVAVPDFQVVVSTLVIVLKCKGSEF